MGGYNLTESWLWQRILQSLDRARMCCGGVFS